MHLESHWTCSSSLYCSESLQYRLKEHVLKLVWILKNMFCFAVILAHNKIFGWKSAYRRATKNSTAWQPTTACLLVMATSNKAVFTVLFWSDGHCTLALALDGHWQKCNPRQTSQKIWRVFLYGVYWPRECFWIDSNSKNTTSGYIKVCNNHSRLAMEVN